MGACGGGVPVNGDNPDPPDPPDPPSPGALMQAVSRRTMRDQCGTVGLSIRGKHEFRRLRSRASEFALEPDVRAGQRRTRWRIAALACGEPDRCRQRRQRIRSGCRRYRRQQPRARCWRCRKHWRSKRFGSGPVARHHIGVRWRSGERGQCRGTAFLIRGRQDRRRQSAVRADVVAMAGGIVARRQAIRHVRVRCRLYIRYVRDMDRIRSARDVRKRRLRARQRGGVIETIAVRRVLRVQGHCVHERAPGRRRAANSIDGLMHGAGHLRQCSAIVERKKIRDAPARTLQQGCQRCRCRRDSSGTARTRAGFRFLGWRCGHGFSLSEDVDRAGLPRLAPGRLALGMRAAATDSARTAKTHQVPCQPHALMKVAGFMRFTRWITDPCRPHGVRFHSPAEKRSMRCASFPDAIHVRNQRFERMSRYAATRRQGVCGNALRG